MLSPSVVKSSTRPDSREPISDMAFASAFVFFGLLPIMLFTGLLMAQLLGLWSH